MPTRNGPFDPKGKTYRLLLTDDGDYYGMCNGAALCPVAYYSEAFNVGVTPGSLEWALTVLLDHDGSLEDAKGDLSMVQTMAPYQAHLPFAITRVIPNFLRVRKGIVFEITTQQINDWIMEMSQRSAIAEQASLLSEQIERSRGLYVEQDDDYDENQL